MRRILRCFLTGILCISALLTLGMPALAETDYDVEVPEENTKGIVNILLLGTDSLIIDTGDQGRADCIIICSLNKNTGAIKLISIERAIYIDIPGEGRDLITHVHNYPGGAQLMQDLIEENFNIDLAGYCEIDFQAFVEIIDTLCGVDIVLTEKEAAGLNGDWRDIIPDNEALTMHEVHPGLNHLDGYDALMYCRLRAIDSDWHRIERQRNMIQAVLDSARQFDFEHNVTSVKAVLKYVKTNLSVLDIASLLLCVDKFTGVTADQMTVPVKTKPITCDYPAESIRIHDFIYGASAQFE